MQHRHFELAASVTTLALAALLGLSGVARAAIPWPPATTPLEQVAELGEFVAVMDIFQDMHAGKCQSEWDGKPLQGKDRTVCDRQHERLAVWRAKHTQLCKDLKVQGGLYGCK
ncbi:MAG TPA: hypothetical protein VLQ80_07140 [Candidatus Saccharimonadia bacterium]|nr:hypothetical protein [Candidatus Saccharimonadia bacterium]